MLDQLSNRIQSWAKRLRGRGALSAQEIDEALGQVRVALLEADVHFAVVKEALERITSRARELKVDESLSAGDRVITLVGEELARMMGERQAPLRLAAEPPTVIMLVGLQGAGKTTTAAKLAKQLKQQGRRVLLVAADPRRPAATEQLQTLGRELLVEVMGDPSGQDAVRLCRAAVERARSRATEVVILDTAGRLHADESLMAELQAIKSSVVPQEVWLVVDAMIGQDALAMAKSFSETIGLSGVIMTKMEGDARGGALLSIRSVCGIPVKYLGTGEKLEALEPFHPDRMASRILGRGDLRSLMERVQAVQVEHGHPETEQLARKIQRDELTLEDFRSQLSQMSKLGSMEEVLSMLPGGQQVQDAVSGGAAEQQLKRVKAIIDSMTLKERRRPEILNGRRRKRIAVGSGTSVQDINQLLRQFGAARRMMKQMAGRRGRFGIGGLGQLFGAS